MPGPARKTRTVRGRCSPDIITGRRSASAIATAALVVVACHGVAMTGLAQGWMAVAKEDDDEEGLLVVAPREDGREYGRLFGREDGRRAVTAGVNEGTRRARRGGSRGVPHRVERRLRT